MSREITEAEFIERFADLIDRFDASIAPSSPAPYAGADAGEPLEHTVRVNFLDEFVELLGWNLGLGGDMPEEARLKEETTTFMDYLGVKESTNTPALLIEAKAWGKPFVQPRRKESFEAPDLIGEGIDHWRRKGTEKDSPMAGKWHEYIDQVGGYVKGLKGLGHTLPRAVITSGQWIVVFIDPVQLFLDGRIEDIKIKVFKKPSFKTQAGELFRLLSKKLLTAEVPFSVEPTQVSGYLDASSLKRCFYALHVNYDVSGSPIFGRRPRVSVYPALLLEGPNDMLVTVLEEATESIFEYTKDQETDEESLAPHLNSLAARASALLERTGTQLGLTLEPAPLVDFNGFRLDPIHSAGIIKPLVNKNPRANDNWVIATGQVTHFAKVSAEVDCRYHSWGACNSVHRAAGDHVISKPVSVRPRALFVDGSNHHCAHRDVMNLKKDRCQLQIIDESFCCKSCVFAAHCWPGETAANLPCGS